MFLFEIDYFNEGLPAPTPRHRAVHERCCCYAAAAAAVRFRGKPAQARTQRGENAQACDWFFRSGYSVSDCATLKKKGQEVCLDAEAPWVKKVIERMMSSAILQLCQPIAVSAGRHMAWATMIQRVIWLSHTAVPERERASLYGKP
ncbi:unnamed protein product [Boreogadus saida]